MAETVTAPAVTTPVATLAAEPTLEQQLEALKPTGAETTTLGTEPTVETKPAEPTIEAQLAEIKDEPVDEKPNALTPAQQQTLALVPDVQTAQQLSSLANGYQNFTNTFASGDFDGVQKMFESWNPQAFEGFLEHIYNQKVMNGDWVERFIADKEGNPTVNRGMQQLQTKIQQLENKLANREQNENQGWQQQQANATAQNYLTHLNGLFDQIKFSQADRRWVTADIHNLVGANTQVKQAIRSGNLAAVNGIFKKAVLEYTKKDQAAAATTAAELDAQGKKIAPLSANPLTEAAGALPSDIRQVPKGREDEWLDQQLAGLAKGKR